MDLRAHSTPRPGEAGVSTVLDVLCLLSAPQAEANCKPRERPTIWLWGGGWCWLCDFHPRFCLEACILCQPDDSVGKGACSQRWVSKLHSWDPRGGSRELTPWPSHKWKINCNFKQLKKKSSTVLQNSKVINLTERSIYVMMKNLNIKIKNRNEIVINKITINP